ncbi:MAG: TAXI family TRAP transporter solute-binding subunit [Hyphomicrobiaceae bacterium]
MVLRQSWWTGLLSLAMCMLMVEAATAQNRANNRPLLPPVDKIKLNLNTVGIMAGKSDSAYLSAVEDMASVLDNGNDLRIIAMLGKGALQNVQDVLSLQNTDMGVTHSNVLTYLNKTKLFGDDIQNRLRYVAKLFNEEVHIVARSSVNDLRDLNGQRVNVGEAGSGTQLTAQLVFEALGVSVTPVNMVQSDALVAIQNGEIAATVLVAGKPSPLFDIFRLKGDLKLLPIPYEEALEAEYLPTEFTHEDYPTLVPEGEVIETIAVPAVLAVFNWRKGTDRYRRVSMFIDAFFSKFEEFRKPPRHPKWREVTLTANVAGWQRFPVAQEWLDRNAAKVAKAPGPGAAPATDTDAQRRTFLEFLATQQGGGGPAVPTADQEALFRHFMSWMQKTQGAQPPAAGAAPRTAAAAPAGQRLW